MNTESAVRDRQLLSQADAEAVVARLYALRPAWQQRHPDAPFHTLGAPSYLDADPRDDTAYRARAQRDNPLLQAHFGELLETLRQALSAALGGPAEYDPQLGLPGFHIFESHPAFCRAVASIHVDRQYQRIVWPQGTCLDEARQHSATLCLRLPSGGGGLRVWPVDSLRLARMSQAERKTLRREHGQPTLHPYRVGQLSLHSGHLFHQIAPAAEALPGEARITLQAHAIPRDGRWLIYW